MKNNLIIILLVLPLLLVGCDRSDPDPEFSIVIDNYLLIPVDIFLDGVFELTVVERGVGLIERLKPGTYQLSAYNGGNQVASETITSEDEDVTWIIQ